MQQMIYLAGRFCKVVAGWFGLYVAIGNLLVYLVTPVTYTIVPSCYPYYSDFLQIESSCHIGAVNIFWAVVLGVPRFALTPVFLAIGLINASMKDSMNLHYLANSLPWVLMSIPFIVIYSGTFFYWRNRDLRVALLIILLISAESMVLGLEV